MAAGYTQKFTLADIFNNYKLKNKLPLIHYKETVDEKGAMHRTTSLKSISRFVYDKAVYVAMPFYNPLKPKKSGNTIILGGNLIEGHSEAVDAVYRAILASKSVLEYTNNYAPLIRDAIKEGEREKPAPKLYLKQTSIEQIAALDKKGIDAFMKDVLQNVMYGDFPKTQKSYGIEDMSVGNHFSYEQNKARWKTKVGDL